MLFPFIKQGEDIFQYLEQLKNEEQEGLSLLLLVKGKKVTVLSKIEFKKIFSCSRVGSNIILN